MKNNQTSFKERLSYGGYFAGQNYILIIILNFLMIFYTDHVGLSAAAAGILFLVARVWDAVNDPIMGIVVDKMNFKKGKFKPWINSVIFLLPLATILLFTNPSSTPEGKLYWAYFTYILWGMIYTISDIPIFALATVMSDNSDERVRIISIGRLAAGIGALVGAIIITPLKVNLGWTTSIVIVAATAMLVMIPVKYFTVERVKYKRSSSVSVRQTLRGLLENKYLLIVYMVIILTNITNSSSTTMVYFVTYNLKNELLIPVLSLAAASSFIVLPLLLPGLISQFGKKKIFIFLMLLSVVSSIAFYFVGYTNIVLVFILIAFKYIALNLPVIMMAMFTTDCLEYGYIKTGKRFEGIVFSVQTFSIKVTLALQGIIGAYTLSRSGYIANKVQTADTLNEIWRMNTIYPIFGQVFAVIIFILFYKLKEEELVRIS